MQNKENKDSSQTLKVRIKAETSRVTVTGLEVKNVSHIKKRTEDFRCGGPKLVRGCNAEMLLLTVLLLQLLL